MTKNEKVLAAVKRAMCEKTTLTSTSIEKVIQQVSADLPPTTPWWVVVLKVLAYAIGLLLAGYGTAQAATVVMPWIH